MPSGFQNSQDQLTPNYYRVTINTSGYSTTANSTAGGGVEVWDYNYFSTLNTSADNSRRRARGNIRWNAILQELQRYSNCEILDVTVLKTGPAAQTAADDTAVSVAFTVGYTQEEFVLGGNQKVVGAGTLVDGSTNLTTSAYESLSAANKATALQNCVKDAVTRGVTVGSAAGYSRRYRTYNPTTVEQRDEPITVVQPDTPANIWATVTVSLIDTMTQQTS
jgi:hypothetical protein